MNVLFKIKDNILTTKENMPFLHMNIPALKLRGMKREG